ncbi:hypothetical protein TYRP_015109 [Tyrophagus putrescentiae]|nr:hypothetical protein TYRP_015109 [Tyrophagus putrescentiae]
MIAFNYDRHFEPLLIVRQILFYPFYNFFLKNEAVQRKNQKIVSVNDQILQLTSLYINFTAYFYLTSSAFCSSSSTTTYCCTLSTTGTTSSKLHADSLLHGQHITLSIVIFTFTLVVFTRLRQANSLLLLSQSFTSKQSAQQSLSLEVFLRFASFHTKTLALITAGNGYFGSLLVYFLLIYLPMNAYLSIQIALGSFPPFPTFIYCNVHAFEYTYIFGFHFLCTFYTAKIHQCAPRLLHYSSVREQFRSLPAKLKLAHYIEKFHTDRRYGITYGDFGLVSFESLFKSKLKLAHYIEKIHTNRRYGITYRDFGLVSFESLFKVKKITF